MTRDPEIRKELDATLHARHELGPEFENELVDGFLEKVQERLDSTIDQRMRRHLAEQQMVVARGSGARPAQHGEGTFGERFGFAAVSLVLAIPLSAIGVANAGIEGLVVAWAGIVGVNALHVGRFFFRRPERSERKKSDWE